MHEVIRFPRKTYAPGSQVRCQYIEIPQVEETFAVILSRPAWLWGAEMGANEHGVCAGNEAVCSRLIGECDDGVERLLGMDIVRLVLERAATARAAVDVAASLLEQHGQGGGCAEGDSGWCYENGFLFADPSEAWVLETAGVGLWAAERVPPGAARNISNGLSIRRPDLLRPGLQEEAARRGWLRPDTAAAAAADSADQPPAGGGFDWKATMLAGRRELAAADLEPDGREAAGAAWLARLAGPVTKLLDKIEDTWTKYLM